MVMTSSLCLTKSLQLKTSKKLTTSLFRARGGSVISRSNLSMAVTADVDAPIDITAERLANLRREMKNDGLDCIIVPTEDPHMSEYTAPYYYRREYISGFTGKISIQIYEPKFSGTIDY